MYKLYIIRHGDFDAGTTRLNNAGKAQIMYIASVLQQENLLIFSSLGPRSTESAELLACLLAKNSTPKEIFGSNTKANQSIYYKKALNYIKKLKSDVVIVTKGEYANSFITYFGNQYLNKPFSKQNLKKGPNCAFLN